MSNKHAILYFDTELNLGRSFNPNKWVNYRIDYYDDGTKALYDCRKADRLKAYLVSGSSDEELQKEIKRIKRNFHSDKWIANRLRNIYD